MNSFKFVAFVVPCLSDLRYIVPFAQALHEAVPIEQVISVQRWSNKYNGLAHDKNFQRCMQILAEQLPWANIFEGVGQTEYDFVIQVETGTSLSCKTRISIQHGFDCAFLVEKLENVDVYICGSKLTGDFASSLIKSRVYVAPIPVPFWRHSNIKQAEKQVTVFYPDSGDVDIANTVVERLIEKKFDVIVKQRSKHQAIRSAGDHRYDSIWYPSEGITLPASSCLTIGFGSSAYTDLVPIGIRYMNIDVHHNVFPWNVFVHPEAENYTRVTDADSIIPTLDVLLERPQNMLKACSDEQLDTFLIELFNG